MFEIDFAKNKGLLSQEDLLLFVSLGNNIVEQSAYILKELFIFALPVLIYEEFYCF